MFSNYSQVLEAIRSGFPQLRVLVVGDAILDRYLWGEVTRISPEAPVPIVRITRQSAVLGGAANVAANLASLGCSVDLVGAAGADQPRDELLQLLQRCGIDGRNLLTVPGYRTIVKTRIIGGHQQLLRIDDELFLSSEYDVVPQITCTALNLISTVDAVVLSDYSKGVLRFGAAEAIIAAANRKGLPILVDPKGLNWESYRGATTITPNMHELALACGKPCASLSVLIEAASEIRRQLGLEFLALTRGESGICLIEDDNSVAFIPSEAKEVFDVCGAGDTVIAVIAAGLAAGLSNIDAVKLANIAAAVVVSKSGTVPILKSEIENQVVRLSRGESTEKIIDRRAASILIERWRIDGEEIVFTNGCFDILHAGHIQSLEAARKQGDRLVVGLNSDESVRRLKGASRPVNSCRDRATVLAALRCVDLVVEFEEDNPLKLIKELRPHILVKGADYREVDVVGSTEVKSWNGKVVLVPLLLGHSTSATIKRVALSNESGQPGLPVQDPPSLVTD